MRLVKDAAETFNRTVAHPSFGELMLVCRRPTYQDVVQYDGMTAAARAIAADGGDATEVYARLFEHVVTTVVTDWREVIDEAGTPIPFAVERFKAACSTYPRLFDRVLAMAQDIFGGEAVNEGEAKNSEQPPAEPSVDAKEQVTGQ